MFDNTTKVNERLQSLIGDDEIVGVIKCSTDYDLFGTGEKDIKPIDVNREINEKHVKKLAESFEEEYLVSPVLVNEKNELIDGQHRFEAAKSKNLPIFYLVVPGYGSKEMRLFNATMSNWSKTEFIKSYAKEGVKEFNMYLEFCKTFPKLDKGACEIILTKAGNRTNTNYSKDIKNGIFKIGDYDKAIEFANHVMEFEEVTPNFKTKRFVTGLLEVSKHPKYNPSRMVEKAILNSKDFLYFNTIQGYIGIFNTTYSKNNKKDKVNLLTK